MRDLNGSNFGIAIAYLIPGFITLWGLAQLDPAVTDWVQNAAQGDLTIGGFLYATLASLSLGLITSTLRWAIIDTIHHRTGLSRPQLSFENLAKRTDAFARIVEGRYHFYQAHSNSAVAVFIAESCWLISGASWLTLLPAVAIEAILLAGSRDCLRGYYTELAQVLGTSPESADPEDWAEK
jgi:hypothetical protein